MGYELRHESGAFESHTIRPSRVNLRSDRFGDAPLGTGVLQTPFKHIRWSSGRGVRAGPSNGRIQPISGN